MKYATIRTTVNGESREVTCRWSDDNRIQSRILYREGSKHAGPNVDWEATVIRTFTK